jgi:hypothetical protein
MTTTCSPAPSIPELGRWQGLDNSRRPPNRHCDSGPWAARHEYPLLGPGRHPLDSDDVTERI